MKRPLDYHKIRDQIIKWKQSPRSKNWQIEQLDTIRTHLTCALMSLWVAFPDLVDEGGGGE